MSQISHPLGCDVQLSTHVCDPCPTPENGRVRSFFLKKRSYTFADPTDKTEWETAILSGDVIIIPDTSGSYDGGTPTTGPGYGDQATRTTGVTYKINLKDPNWLNNEVFYEAAQNTRQWTCGFRTANYCRMFTSVASIFGKDPVEDDLKSEVVWNVEVTIEQTEKPTVFATPADTFECYTITA